MGDFSKVISNLSHRIQLVVRHSTAATATYMMLLLTTAALMLLAHGFHYVWQQISFFLIHLYSSIFFIVILTYHSPTSFFIHMAAGYLYPPYTGYGNMCSHLAWWGGGLSPTLTYSLFLLPHILYIHYILGILLCHTTNVMGRGRHIIVYTLSVMVLQVAAVVLYYTSATYLLFFCSISILYPPYIGYISVLLSTIYWIHIFYFFKPAYTGYFSSIFTHYMLDIIFRFVTHYILDISYLFFIVFIRYILDTSIYGYTN